MRANILYLLLSLSAGAPMSMPKTVDEKGISARGFESFGNGGR